MYFHDFSPLSIISFFVICYLLHSLAYFNFFKKADKKPWIAFVPFYNYYTHLEIIGRPKWWIILLLIPLINFFVALTMLLDLMKSFGKYTYLDQALGVIFPPIYLNYIAWSNTSYVGKAVNIPKQKKSFSQEWFEAVVFAVFCATFIRWIFMEAYVIPTPSMEKSLLVGDFLFVSKAEYGARTPQTPLQVPLTHQKIWGTEIPSYLRWVSLPSFRLPSFGTVERNDVVVFNYPPHDQFNRRRDGQYHPLDLGTHYIKRCVAVAGDMIEVRGGQVYINGEEGENPEKLQLSYFVETDQSIRDRIWDNYKITEYNHVTLKDGRSGYIILTNEKNVEKIKKLPFVKNIEVQLYNKENIEQDIFPDYRYFRWNRDHYGPLKVPYRGMNIEINEEVLAKYGSSIKNYENQGTVVIDTDQLIINGESMSNYTFKKDYYFMMGDNRHNSLDSRFWGFVSEDYIVGEASFVWMSFDNNKTFLSKIRWNRLFMGIK